MYASYTVLFLDYQGKPDYETYTGTCLPDIERQFNRDHPTRKLVFIYRGLYGGVLKALGLRVLCQEANVYTYHAVYQEEQTGYIEVYNFEVVNAWNEQVREHEAFLLARKEHALRCLPRQEAGGFALHFVGVWQMYPYKQIEEI